MDMPPIPLLIAYLGLAAAALALGAPRVLAKLPRTPLTSLWATGALSAAFVLARLASDRFDPYWLAIFAATTWAALEALSAVPDGAPLGPVDLIVWLALWIPFDLRWTNTLMSDSYSWWSLYLVIVAAIGWGRLRRLPGFDFRLFPPHLRDLAPVLPGFLGVLVLCVPIGLALHFLSFPGKNMPASLGEGLRGAAIAFPLIFLTIALPEELFFRGVLQGGIERRLGRPWPALAIASVAFGLMHWNNVSEDLAGVTDGRTILAYQLTYFSLATIAGAVYGLAYRWGGSILAPAIVHALVDTAWHFLFQA